MLSIDNCKKIYINTYLLLVFLLLKGPLLNAQSTLIICVSSSAPSITDIAFSASSKCSYSISAYPCQSIFHARKFRATPTRYDKKYPKNTDTHLQSSTYYANPKFKKITDALNQVASFSKYACSKGAKL